MSYWKPGKQTSEEETDFSACSENIYGSYNYINDYYKIAFGLYITYDTNNILSFPSETLKFLYFFNSLRRS